MLEQTPITYISLSQLAGQVKAAMDAAFGGKDVWVVAEVSGHSYRAARGQHFFELLEKDSSRGVVIAKMSGKAWGFGSDRIAMFENNTGQKFTNGIQYLLKVRVDFHSEFGLSLSVVDIDPNYTIGQHALQREMTLRRLLVDCKEFVTKVGDEYVTRNKRLPLPLVIQRIALITGATAAGKEDFRDALAQNVHGYHFEVDSYFCMVQGEDKAHEVRQRLIDVYQSGKPYDVVVITRGGGTDSDLFIFDRFEIAQVVAKFPVPVITAIGHKRNQSIADLMANQSVITPTQAAAFVVTHNRGFEDQLTEMQKTVVIKAQQRMATEQDRIQSRKDTVIRLAREMLSHQKELIGARQNGIVAGAWAVLGSQDRRLNAAMNLFTMAPQKILHGRQVLLSVQWENLKLGTRGLMKNQEGYLGHHVSVMKLMKPENILKRGFAYVKVGGKIQAESDQLKAGASFELVMEDAIIDGKVINRRENHGE